MAEEQRGLGIDASGLSKSYGNHRVLDGVDLCVERGRLLALLGPNGAGKTTIVRVLATLLRPEAGQARVAGYDVLRERSQVRRRISLTGQFAALDEQQTGSENLEMIARLRQLPAAEARLVARDLLRRFELAEAADRRVASYSGGMRRRLDLAAGLIGDPKVVFLDEPTVGLDPRSRQVMWQIVRGLTDAGTTVLLTTQYLDEADALADRIVVLDNGRVVAEGSPGELKRRVGGERLDLQLTDRVAFAQVAARLGDDGGRTDQYQLRISIPVPDNAAKVRELLDELDPDRQRIASFSLQQASLDDVFMALTEPDSTPGS
jgi:ABC-2 type transport system ATP-binding protein